MWFGADRVGESAVRAPVVVRQQNSAIGPDTLANR
ncbi:MAG: hypothetical protein J07HX5_01829, partial [halophilic archaeon J07HX5]